MTRSLRVRRLWRVARSSAGMFTRHRHDPPDKLNCPHAMRPGAPPPCPRTTGRPSFQELAQLGCRLELRNGIEFLECGSERIRNTPDRPCRNSSYFGSWAYMLSTT